MLLAWKKPNIQAFRTHRDRWELAAAKAPESGGEAWLGQASFSKGSFPAEAYRR